MTIENQLDNNYGFQTESDRQFPPVVQIALMHYICNSNCVNCPVGRMNMGELENNKEELNTARRTFFPWKIFQKIACEMAKHPGSILRFHGRGEPLLHPRYIDMVTFAKREGVTPLTSFTNGILLTEDKALALLEAGIDMIEFSVDAYTEDLYLKLRRNEYFYKVVENVERIIKLRNQLRKSTRIVVSAVDQPEFQEEKDDFKTYWEERADAVLFRPYHTYAGRLEQKYEDSGEYVPCVQLWARFSISPTGLINACFNDWGDEEIIGDLNSSDSSIESIWRNPEFEKIRECHLKGEIVLDCCNNCHSSISSWTFGYQHFIKQILSKPLNSTLK